MKLNVGEKKIHGVYIVRLQSRVPKFQTAFGKKKNKWSARPMQRKAISVRVIADSVKDAGYKALKRKQTMSRALTYRFLSARLHKRLS